MSGLQNQLEQVSGLGTIVGIWAHPDDETFSSAGLMSMARANGQEVICITATYGEAGVQNPDKWPAEDLARIRKLESDEAMKCLGVEHHYWLDYKDGFCNQITDEAALSAIMPIIERHKPDTIISFGPDGLTGHTDHKTASRWASLAAEASKKPVNVLYSVVCEDIYNDYLKAMDDKLNIFFNIDEPKLYGLKECQIVLNLAEKHLKRHLENKCQAIAAMPSQTETMLQNFGMDYLCDAFGKECFISA